MMKKPKNLFLYLALACFLSLVAIFIADGYLGIYDTIYVTIGEQEQVIEPDYWLQQYPPESREFEMTYYIGAQSGQRVFFRYEIDNRRFSSYSTLVKASLWQENEKVLDLFSENISIGSFDMTTMEWTLSTEGLEAPVPGTIEQYTVKISHGETERKIVVEIFYPEDYIVPPEKLR